MPTTTPLTDAIEALTTYSNTVTGASDTTLSEAVATLAAGYGGGGSSGGLANMVNENDATVTYAYMLSAMKNGGTKGGTITWENAFPNTETLLLSTGLTQLNGIILARTDRGLDSTTSNNQTNEFVLILCRNYTNNVPENYAITAISMNHAFSQNVNHAWNTAYNNAPENGKLRLDGGDIYFTGRYDQNNNYQIVRSGQQYEWLAW